MIGLIDGVFEYQASLWHKEILYALSCGVIVAGAASMGALRAAECHAFGMVGVGAVFEALRSGAIEDDEAVAQLHAPAELGYLPLTEPMVNVRATLSTLVAAGRLSVSEHASLLAAAERLFFKERSWKRIVAEAGISASRSMAVLADLRTGRVDLKRQDAVELLRRMCGGELSSGHGVGPTTWTLAKTRSLKALLGNDV